MALAFAAGILAANALVPGIESVLLLFALVLVLALIAEFLAKNRSAVDPGGRPAGRSGVARTRAALLLIAVSLAGQLAWLVESMPLSSLDLRRQFDGEPAWLELEGVLAAEPELRIYESRRGSSQRSYFLLNVEKTRPTGSSWAPARGRVLVSVASALPEKFFSGIRVIVPGVLARPEPAAIPGLFDYREYLRRQNVDFILRADSSSDWTAGNSNASRPWPVRFNRWAKRMLAIGFPESDPMIQLQWAMTLGWKTALTPATTQAFMESGTMHLFAISGLHITLLAFILLEGLRIIRIPRSLCGLLVIGLIWFYTAATQWQPSAVRSTLMTSVVMAGWTFRRPPDLLNSLFAAAALILAWDPQQLFQASFQLSFVVVLMLALFIPLTDRLRSRLERPDLFLPEKLKPWWKRTLQKGVNWLVLAFATCLVAWVGSMPLCACYFHLWTPNSLLANLVAIPVGSIVLACNVGAIVSGAWFPWAAELLNNTGWLGMQIMIGVSRWAANLPAATWHVSAPGIAEFVFYYFAVALAWWKYALNRPVGRLLLSAFTVIGLMAAASAWDLERRRELLLLPLAGGQAILHHQSGGDSLVDCGNQDSFDRSTLPALQSRGVNNLERLVLTHGDAAHVGAGPRCVDSFRPAIVAANAAPSRSSAFNHLIDWLKKEKRDWIPLEDGTTAGPFEILHPGRKHFTRADDNCLVLSTSVAGVRILFLGDLGSDGAEDLLQRRSGRLESDIVVAGLPSRGEPLPARLLREINPRMVIILDSRLPVRDRATAALRKRIHRFAKPAWFASECGAIVIREARQGVELIASNGEKESIGPRSNPTQ